MEAGQSDPEALRWNRPGKRLRSLHRSSSACLRYGPIRVLVVVLGWIVACGVGAVLWRAALKFREQEFDLKCENRKEVSLLLWSWRSSFIGSLVDFHEFSRMFLTTRGFFT